MLAPSMTTMALQRLSLPSLGRLRLVSPRPYRQLRLSALRCSAGQQGDEELPPSEDMSNMLRSFGSRPGPPPATGGGSSSSSSSSRPSTFKGFGQPPKEKPSATEALLSSLGGVSEAEGRRSIRNNIVLGADDSEESWRELDSQVNEYPGNRTLKAIGSGGQEFAESMRACAEKVVGPLHEECVSTRPSSKGNYLSVTLTFWVETPEQVRAVYNNMREDPRLRYVI